VTIPFDSDATRAAVTAAAQAVQADAERQGHQLTYEQCEELAIAVIGHYQAFMSGVSYATGAHATTDLRQ
jgi:hypothetical protein